MAKQLNLPGMDCNEMCDCNKTYLPEDTVPEQSTDYLDMQIGGDHYTRLAIQPIEFIERNNIPFIEGCIIKYAVRHMNKGGVKDLEKIKHYVNLLIELRYGDG